MRRIEAEAAPGSEHQETLTLPFELRQKSRLRARLDSGEEVALLLPRGRVLRGGDRLCIEDGSVVLVRAKPERVSTARSADPHALARAAYHLGNRHIAVQLGAGWLRYLHDHVLDDMLRVLGLELAAELAPFEPEAGAYGHGHAHGHGHGHAQTNGSTDHSHGEHQHDQNHHHPHHDPDHG